MDENRKPTVVLVAAIGSLVLGFCCCGQGTMTATMPIFFGVQKKMMQSLSEAQRTRLASQRQALEEQRAATTDSQEIAAIDRQIAMLDGQAPPDMAAFYDAFTGPAVARSYMFEGLSGLVANLLIFIAAFGLLAMKPWARTLAIWASAGRILAALVYAVLTVTVVMPALTEGMRKFQESIANGSAAPGQPPVPDMGPMLAIQSTVGAVIGIMMVVAWPVALLIMLHTKTAREALSPEAEARRRQLASEQDMG